jgi:hypothetical protein
MSYRVMYRVTSWNNKKIAFPGKSPTAAGNATLAGVRLLNMFISAPSHHTLNLVHARAARMRCTSIPRVLQDYLHLAHHPARGWRTEKTCPNFALWPLYRVFAMTSRTTVLLRTWCKNSEVGLHVCQPSVAPAGVAAACTLYVL